MLFQSISWRKCTGWGVVVSLIVILATFWVVRARYESRLRRQIWPVSIPAISIVTNPAAASAPTVMLLGDSRMAQWGLPEITHWRVVNAGTGGLTTGQILQVTPELLDEFRPNVIVLQAGINDLKFLGLHSEMAPTIISLAISNFTAIIDESTKHQCQVIVLETWPVGQPGWARKLVWNGVIPGAVNQINTELWKLNAPEQGIRVVDLFNEAGLKSGANLYKDALHFMPEVYQRLTPALQKVLDAKSPQTSL
jgi:lysophospholipase L1-like esterase